MDASSEKNNKFKVGDLVLGIDYVDKTFMIIGTIVGMSYSFTRPGYTIDCIWKSKYSSPYIPLNWLETELQLCTEIHKALYLP